jgi:hypothetical protein
MRMLVLILGVVMMTMPLNAAAKEGCQTKACHKRVAKRHAVERAGVPWCHMTWRCVRRGLRRHPHLNGAGELSGVLARIASCESGGNPRAVGGGGKYRGKYQFDYRTWASVGGTGDPAAASEREQDYRASLLYRQRGSRPWPVCGR